MAKHRQHHSTQHVGRHHSTHRSRRKHHSTRGHGGNGGEFVEDAGERVMSATRNMQKGAVSAFGIFNGPMANMMDQNWSLLQRTLQIMQQESLRFFNRRMEHASHVMEDSRDVQVVSGFMHLQQEWALDFARDCSEQATRFAQLMGELVADSAERFADASSDALERGQREFEEQEHAIKREEEEHRASA